MKIQKSSIDKSIEIIKERHQPNSPLPNRYVQQHEKRLGYSLPIDLKHFYESCNGASLFQNTDLFSYRILPLKDVKRTRILIFGRDSDEFAPKSWHAICDLGDNNYIGIDLLPKRGETYPIIDCFHETHGLPGKDKIIARSFTEFLHNLLNNNGKPYWLSKQFKVYGAAKAR